MSTRNRKKFTEIEYQVWAVYPDEAKTEDLVEKFKYRKSAEKYVTKWIPSCDEVSVKLEIREVQLNVL